MGAEVTLRELAERLAGSAEAVCAELLPGGRVIGAEYRAASIYGGAGNPKTGGSLAVALKGAKRGLWADFATDEKGDMLDLVAATLHCPLAEAAGWARAYFGLGTADIRASSLSDFGVGFWC